MPGLEFDPTNFDQVYDRMYTHILTNFEGGSIASKMALVQQLVKGYETASNRTKAVNAKITTKVEGKQQIVVRNVAGALCHDRQIEINLLYEIAVSRAAMFSVARQEKINNAALQGIELTPEQLRPKAELLSVLAQPFEEIEYTQHEFFQKLCEVMSKTDPQGTKEWVKAIGDKTPGILGLPRPPHYA
ncbi:hypothetical protein K504DRAFT_498832 [Pleomassaria siparia CBS 279.74]|uniref:Uncharacterized protein n=1 Tax=Pleomassaria siparia CBS 279.74 TaxID=1314801 RepID=A0A6G1KMI5_9PLEO|nr:hypothetical protein K504DRAFT_498832 [Pleomassaria siparia CBS 279.74]